jgi:hypothetical protein
MRHFDITEWTDFVLGTTTAEKRDEMAIHLESGCPDCLQVRSLIERVRRTAVADALYVPPSDLVEAVTALAKPRTVPRRPLLQRLVATLTYDSFNGLQPEGARGEQPASRQLALKAGSYRIELQMERSHSHVTLVGQFGCEGETYRVDNRPVLLLTGGSVVARGVTNDFGEFCLEYRHRTRLRLCIDLGDLGTQIEVPLSQLEA